MDYEKERIKARCNISYNGRCYGDGKACKADQIPGRLIPVPRSISAGCGLSWCALPGEEDAIREEMKKVGIEEEALHQVMV